MQVVIWDPAGELFEGQLVDGQKARVLESKGVVMLPVEASLIDRSGAGGWIKRAWGAGADLPSSCRSCRAAMFVSTGIDGLYWVARLVRVASTQPRGRLTLSADSSQPGISLEAGVSQVGGPIQLDTLGEADEHGGWTVTGQLRLNAAREGFVGLSFYGLATDVCIRWLAVSQAAM